LTIVLYVLLWYTVSYYLFGIFWPLYCMSFFDILFLITSLVSFDHCRRTYNTMVNRYQRGNKKQYFKEGHSIQCSKDTKEVIRNSISKKDIQYKYTVSYYLFGIFWPLYWMSLFDVLFLITSLVSFDHCIECPSLKYCFLLPLLYRYKRGNKKQ
jgi:hypothetical protein